MSNTIFTNPFRPGAGHPPPFLAGRDQELKEFSGHLLQQVITDNPILTGLRGVGKTVLLDACRPIALQAGWLWVGTDMSESASLTEERLALRLLADLSVATAQFSVEVRKAGTLGFAPTASTASIPLNFDTLHAIYQQTPGLVVDKLKGVLEFVAQTVPPNTGLAFAYDEAQNLADHVEKNEYPLSVLLDLFQSIQRKGFRFMLVLVGLPTLLPKLVEARTSAERMFHVITLEKLNAQDSRVAIVKPIENCPVSLTETLIKNIVDESGGYPYFIQFICREVYDIALQKSSRNEPLVISIPDITRKLDADFFAGRWARATDRQRDLLRVIASLESSESEFTVQEIVQRSKVLEQEKKIEGFSPSHVSQILSALADRGFVYKNRHGKYSLAVPLLDQFIRRQPWN